MYQTQHPVLSFRIVVRIDSWEPESQYPNGHFVRSLGKSQHLETEIAAILLEHDLSAGPFSDVQVITVTRIVKRKRIYVYFEHLKQFVDVVGVRFHPKLALERKEGNCCAQIEKLGKLSLV